MRDLPVRRFRTIFISDVHLGTRACKAEFLLDFLRHCESDHLYLVGDIVDGWSLKRSWYCEQSHVDVLQKVLRRARKGSKVTYIPGNHDEAFRAFVGHRFGRIRIEREAVHETADGRKLLVVHGDEHDVVILHARWLALLGDWGYQTAVAANHWLNCARRWIGRPYWSLSGFLKRSVKRAVDHVDTFERSLADEARRRGLDGVVCGHVHAAQIRDIDGILYCNDGDWVDTCTALVEHHDGRLEILDWMQERAGLLYASRSWEVELDEAELVTVSTLG